MSEGVVIPLSVSGAERVQLQFNEVVDSLSRMERKLLELGTASEDGQRRVLELTQKFKDGKISAEQFRHGLTSMIGDLPKTSAELRKAAEAAEKIGTEATAAAPHVRTLGTTLASLGAAARHINEIREIVVTFAQALYHAAERVGELAGEQQRLTANSARLGLDFSRAAENAGGFVSEMQTMQLATSLANRNIRVTQTELDALARVGMARAVDAGKNVEEVFDSIADSVVEGGEELEKFGSSLHSVSDDSHTASERLSALVDRGRGIAPAMRTAADSVAQFSNEVRQAGRSFSQGFAEEIVRISQMTQGLRSASTAAEDMRQTFDAIGRTVARMTSTIGNGIGAVLSSWAYLGARATQALGLSSAQTSQDIGQFFQRRLDALEALAADTENRTTAPEERPPEAPPDMVITQAEITPRDTARRSGTGRTQSQRESLSSLMGRAWERTGARADVRVLGEQTPEQLRESGERIRGGIREEREAQQRKGREAYERSDAGVRASVEQERIAARERRALDERRDNMRDFSDFMEQQYTRQMNIAREGADAVAMSVRAMGAAYADNLVAWADGSKTFEEAANDMLATTLSTIAKEAAAKSAFNFAEGLFALATYRYDAAALHFAAAAGYGVLAYGAGYASSSVREQRPQRDAASGASSENSRRRAAPMAGESSRASGSTVINVAFNGPQYGTGGVVQAARDLARVINAGAIQGGVQLNPVAVGAGLRG